MMLLTFEANGEFFRENKEKKKKIDSICGPIRRIVALLMLTAPTLCFKRSEERALERLETQLKKLVGMNLPKMIAIPRRRNSPLTITL